ncbi:sugar diacid utilization regulator SdaR [Lachnotalea glycerini]|uniref:Sugar diacid utilization regulator SdaR n=2 Tax=Lachnotalea glycerini TaxID=1763509 RepID=A0A371JHS5_9FIRM|nr:sugar diacid utilization regulator SdaR [Lachnotalea glycerini]
MKGILMITKINESLAQQIVDTVKDVCGQDINFIDEEGTIFASTNTNRIGDFHEIGFQVAQTHETIEVKKESRFYGTQQGVNVPIFHNGSFLAVIGISGEPELVRKFAYLAIRITKLFIREQELEASNRTQQEQMNYIIHALTKGEITNREYLYECLQERKLDKKQKIRVVIFKLKVDYNIANRSSFEQKLFQMFDTLKLPLYTYHYPNDYVAMINEKELSFSLQILKSFAQDNNQILEVGIGSSHELLQLKHSYESAKIALKSLERTGQNIASFDQLDIDIVLGSLDSKIMEHYLEKTVASLCEEDKELLTIYYAEDMSLQKTAERLYLHKNTLQYKLDRIARLSGYNPRTFKEAVVLYIGIIMSK